MPTTCAGFGAIQPLRVAGVAADNAAASPRPDSASTPCGAGAMPTRFFLRPNIARCERTLECL